MRPLVWKKENPETQTVWFQGYTTVYHEDKTENIYTGVWRKNRLQAKSDAEKLIKRLRNKHGNKKPNNT